MMLQNVAAAWLVPVVISVDVFGPPATGGDSPPLESPLQPILAAWNDAPRPIARRAPFIPVSGPVAEAAPLTRPPSQSAESWRPAYVAPFRAPSMLPPNGPVAQSAPLTRPAQTLSIIAQSWVIEPARVSSEPIMIGVLIPPPIVNNPPFKRLAAYAAIISAAWYPPAPRAEGRILPASLTPVPPPPPVSTVRGTRVAIGIGIGI